MSTPRKTRTSLALGSATKQDLLQMNTKQHGDHFYDKQDLSNPLSSPYRGINLNQDDDNDNDDDDDYNELITKTPRKKHSIVASGSAITPNRNIIIASATPSKLKTAAGITVSGRNTPKGKNSLIYNNNNNNLHYDEDNDSERERGGLEQDNAFELENEKFIKHTNEMIPMSFETEENLINNFEIITDKFKNLQNINNSLSNFNESFASFLYGFNINAYCCSFNQVINFKSSLKKNELINLKKFEIDKLSGDVNSIDLKLNKLKLEIQKLRNSKRLQKPQLRRPVINSNRQPTTTTRTRTTPTTPTTSSSSGIVKHTNFLRGSGKSSLLKRQRESIQPISSRSITPSSSSNRSITSSSNRSINTINKSNIRNNIKKTEDWSIKGRKPFR